MIKDQIVSSIAQATGLSVEDIVLDIPSQVGYGDYSTNIALQSFKQKKTNVRGTKIRQYPNLISGDSPIQMAQNIKASLDTNKSLSTIVSEITIAGPGFINFYLTHQALADTLIDINTQKDIYGRNTTFGGIRTVVEYTDPNPFKEFHIGHLISNLTGESIAKLFEACGAIVWRADYFGDVGVHVAKSIWGIRKNMQDDGVTLKSLLEKDLPVRIAYMGKGYALGTRMYDTDEAVKSEIQRLNTVLYLAAQKLWVKEQKQVINYDPKGAIPDSEVDSVYDLYTQGRKWSLEYFETIYERLGTKFDGYYPESRVGEIGYQLVKANIGKVFEESEGAVIFKGEKYGLHTRVFINKHNLPTYEAKELGLAPAKYADFAYDKSIIVVGREIKEYFEVLVEALKKVNPKLGNATTPVCTGMVNLPEGKMSSRKGNVVTVSSLLDSLASMVMKRIENQDYSQLEKTKIAEMVAVGALKYAFLKNSVGSDFIFDITTALSLEGNSGPYLQYTYARTQSLINKARVGEDVTLDTKSIHFDDSEALVARSLVHFSEIVSVAARSMSPNLLCNYLYDLAGSFNNFYNSNRVIGSDNETLRLLLTKAVGQVLKNGLFLLGIETPDKM